MIRVVVIDDEQTARDTVKNLLEMNFPQVEVVGEADSVDGGVEVLSDKTPDLAFLDIDINGGTGFNILQKLGEVDFKVIFITAFNNYAIKAIKFNALDYIVKPVNEFEFISGVERVIKEIEKHYPTQKFSHLTDDFDGECDTITLKTSDCLHLIKVDKIVRCESDNSYTTFHIDGDEKVMVSKSIKYYDDLLNDMGFYRVHQSHLVNKKYLSKYVKRDGGYIKMQDGSSIPVSVRKKDEVVKLFR